MYTSACWIATMPIVKRCSSPPDSWSTSRSWVTDAMCVWGGGTHTSVMYVCMYVCGRPSTCYMWRRCLCATVTTTPGSMYAHASPCTRVAVHAWMCRSSISPMMRSPSSRWSFCLSLRRGKDGWMFCLSARQPARSRVQPSPHPFPSLAPSSTQTKKPTSAPDDVPDLALAHDNPSSKLTPSGTVTTPLQHAD